MSISPPSPAAGSSGGDDDFVAEGNWGEVRHARRLNGSMEAKEWLEKKATISERAKFDHLFRWMAEFGQIRNTELFRSLEDGIYEFKKDSNRVFCFQQGRCWRLTHHYRKGGQKCPRKQIDRAIQIRDEFLG